MFNIKEIKMSNKVIKLHIKNQVKSAHMSVLIKVKTNILKKSQIKQKINKVTQ